MLWEHLTDATHEESTLSITYLAFITPATMIAACGVVLDNAILIVGAMAVALHEGGACRPVHRGPVGGRPATDRVPGQTVGFIEQLLLNLLGILLAGTLTLLTQKWLWSTRRRRRSNAGRRGAGNCASNHTQRSVRGEQKPPPPPGTKHYPSADFTASANRPATDRA